MGLAPFLIILGGVVFGFFSFKNAMDKKDGLGQIAAAAKSVSVETGIPLSIIVAQAAHESNYGRSGLALQSNNLFGIKAQIGYAGKFDEWPTWESVNGERKQVMARFRKYVNWEESVRDWATFLKKTRYEKALAAARAGQPANFFKELQLAGYATDPGYALKLTGIYESLKDAIA